VRRAREKIEFSIFDFEGQRTLFYYIGAGFLLDNPGKKNITYNNNNSRTSQRKNIITDLARLGVLLVLLLVLLLRDVARYSRGVSTGSPDEPK